MSEAEARKVLAEEERKRVEAGGVVLNVTSADTFLSMGLDLEDAKYVSLHFFIVPAISKASFLSCCRRHIRRQAKAKASSTNNSALAELRSGLETQSQAWEQLLPIYMPGLLQYKSDHPREATSENPEDTFLWMPSEVAKPFRERVCTAGLVKI